MATLFSRLPFLASIAFLTVSVIIANFHLSTGTYDTSVYEAYPVTFWLSLTFSIIISLVKVLYEVFYNPKRYLWLPSYLILIASNLLLLAIPLLRHYAFTTPWDAVNHYSFIKSIIDHSFPSDGNFYPAVHTHAASFKLLSGIDLHNVLLLYPLFFYSIYLLNVAFVAWNVSDIPGVRGLILLIAAPLSYQAFAAVFRPTHFVVYLLPLGLGLLYKKMFKDDKIQFQILMLLLLLLLPFFHPWGVIAFIVVILCFSISQLLIKNKSISNLTSVQILLISWFAWFSTFAIFGKTLQRIIDAFIDGITGFYSIGSYVDKAQRASLPIQRILSFLIFTYGPALLYCLLVAIAFIAIVKLMITHRLSQKHFLMVATTIFAFLFITFAAVSVIRDMVTEGPFRILNFVFALVPFIVGQLFFNEIQNINNLHSRISRIALLGFVITGVFLISFYTVFQSSIIGQANLQVTYSEEAGIRFLVEKTSNNSKSIVSPGAGGFLVSSIGNVELVNRIQKEQPRLFIQLAAPNFVYENEQLNQDLPGYLFITSSERNMYSNVWPERGRFERKDFVSLENNPNWSLIYSSGDFSLWWRHHD